MRKSRARTRTAHCTAHCRTACTRKQLHLTSASDPDPGPGFPFPTTYLPHTFLFGMASCLGSSPLPFAPIRLHLPHIANQSINLISLHSLVSVIHDFFWVSLREGKCTFWRKGFSAFACLPQCLCPPPLSPVAVSPATFPYPLPEAQKHLLFALTHNLSPFFSLVVNWRSSGRTPSHCGRQKRFLPAFPTTTTPPTSIWFFLH